MSSKRSILGRLGLVRFHSGKERYIFLRNMACSNEGNTYCNSILFLDGLRGIGVRDKEFAVLCVLPVCTQPEA